jgi:hypothetical protein
MSDPPWQSCSMNSWNILTDALTEWIRSRTRTVLALLRLTPEHKSEQLTLPLGEMRCEPVPVRKGRPGAGTRRRFSR